MDELLEPAFRVDQDESADGLVIRLIGEMDMSNVDQARKPILAAMDGDGGKPVVIDLSELEFIDSSGIRLLLEAQAASNADSNRLSFRGAREQVAQTLRVTAVDETINLSD
ncbi:MAG: STAS domain-containing protein [Solirubrobacterales bacterium]